MCFLTQQVIQRSAALTALLRSEATRAMWHCWPYRSPEMRGSPAVASSDVLVGASRKPSPRMVLMKRRPFRWSAA